MCSYNQNVRGILYIVAILLMAGIVLVFWQFFPDTELNGITMELKSAVFKEGEKIPAPFTCDGDEVNPLLEIKNAPEGVRSFALIVDDPDATGGKTFTHWTLWDISASAGYISEDSVPGEAVEGTTSFGKIGYGGPCPPKGSVPHRYRFTLYALDAKLGLPEGASRAALEEAMKGHVIAETTLTGRYGR